MLLFFTSLFYYCWKILSFFQRNIKFCSEKQSKYFFFTKDLTIVEQLRPSFAVLGMARETEASLLVNCKDHNLNYFGKGHCQFMMSESRQRIK